MTRTGFSERALDCLVDISALDGIEWDRLVSCVHHRQILDVFEIINGNTGLNPAGSPVGEVVPTVRTFVDGVMG